MYVHVKKNKKNKKNKSKSSITKQLLDSLITKLNMKGFLIILTMNVEQLRQYSLSNRFAMIQLCCLDPKFIFNFLFDLLIVLPICFLNNLLSTDFAPKNYYVELAKCNEKDLLNTIDTMYLLIYQYIHLKTLDALRFFLF